MRTPLSQGVVSTMLVALDGARWTLRPILRIVVNVRLRFSRYADVSDVVSHRPDSSSLPRDHSRESEHHTSRYLKVSQ